VTKKFDQFELSNSNVTSVFNDLCLQIKEKVQDLEETAALLTKTFGADLFLLFRLIPNVQLLLPEQPFLDVDIYDHGDQMNMMSVAFIISTFARVVSSKSNPIMIFLDDIQWVSQVSQSSLSVLETILSDKETCLLLVGNYRDNEVNHGHPIYHFMGILENAKVRTTKMTLQGLDVSALNALVSDSTGLLPRLTVSLSELIHQKTKGNPFFSLQLLKSLVARGLVQFSITQRKWLWEEIMIRNDICIASNVLFLLTNKLNQLLPGTVQVLKVLSTFGIFVPDDVVEMLSSTGQHADIHGCLESLVCDSFLVQVEGGYKL
jgi:predicted ATPase